MSAPYIQVTVGADLGAKSFRLEATIDPKELDQTLDLMNKSIGRQQSRQDLVFRIMDLREAKLWLASWPEPKLALATQRMVERNAQEAEFRRQHEASNKRLDWRPSQSQAQWLAAFDQQTEQQLKAVDSVRKDKQEKLIPNLEEQIERLRGICNGDDPVEELEEANARIAAD